MNEGVSDKLFDLRKWISDFCTDNPNWTNVFFREALVIALKDDSANDIKPVGGYCIQVEPVGPEGRNFLVHVHSSMTIDGHFSGMKLMSTMTDKLQCLEEKHTESFIYKPDGLHEISLLMGLEQDTYHVEITHTCPCSASPLTEAKDLSLCQYEDFIGEGTSVLLMRCLAIMNHVGVLRLRNITMDGEVAISDYNCSALRDMELYGRRQKVYTVEREIRTNHDNMTQRVKIYLTSQGRILLHDWLDTPYIAQTNPLYMQDERSEIVDMQIPLRERWMQDIEMLSKYLDMKSYNASQYTDYLVDHPEIKQLIADYVQTLLVGNQLIHRISFIPNLLRQVVSLIYLSINDLLSVKPVDVIDFTIQHFKAFARQPKVWDTDSFAKQSDIDINSQLSRYESDTVCGFCGVCIKCKVASQFDEQLPE